MSANGETQENGCQPRSSTPDDQGGIVIGHRVEREHARFVADRRRDLLADDGPFAMQILTAQIPFGGRRFSAARLCISDAIAERLGMKQPRGALVLNVDATGLAKSAGIEPGDVIVSVDGTDINEYQDLPRLLADNPLGKYISATAVAAGM